MKELRFLDVSTGFLDEGTRISCFQWNWIFNTFSPYLPESLRYLRWNHYPFTSLPKTFEADNLVALSMSESGISQLLEGGERKVALWLIDCFFMVLYKGICNALN